MAKTFLEKYGDLPLPVQIGIPVGGYFLVVRPLLDKLGGNKDSGTTTVAEANDAVQDLADQGINLTYGITWYEDRADAMQSAMFDLGTYEDVINSTFENCENLADVMQLIASFGKRPYYYFGIKQGNYTLSQWFSEELDEDDYDDINTILANKGINYYF